MEWEAREGTCDSRVEEPNDLNQPDDDPDSSRRLGEGGTISGTSPAAVFVFSPNFKLLRLVNHPPDLDSFRKGFDLSSGADGPDGGVGERGVDGDSGVWIIGGSGGTGGGTSAKVATCPDRDGEEADGRGERSIPDRLLSTDCDEAVLGRAASEVEGARRMVFNSFAPKLGMDGDGTMDGVVGVSCAAASNVAGVVSMFGG